MILVDSSVWIDFYNGIITPAVRRLRSAIDRDTVIVGDLVMAEVLQGMRSERRAAIVEADLRSFDLVDVAGSDVAVLAAKNYRDLRARGITVRKTIDCLIATRCIVEGWSLLYSDRDFDPFVAHLGLRSALAGAA